MFRQERTGVMTTTTVDYRVLTAADEPAVHDLYTGMNHEDRNFRYIGCPPSDYEAVARALAGSDSHHAAMGAFVEGDLVGVANFIVLETKTAEVAIVVEHDAQGRGIGTGVARRVGRPGSSPWHTPVRRRDRGDELADARVARRLGLSDRGRPCRGRRADRAGAVADGGFAAREPRVAYASWSRSSRNSPKR